MFIMTDDVGKDVRYIANLEIKSKKKKIED